MKIYKEESLRNFEFWSCAKKRAARLTYEQLDQKENPSLYSRLAADYDIDTYQGAIDAVNAVNAGEYEDEDEEEDE